MHLITSLCVPILIASVLVFQGSVRADEGNGVLKVGLVQNEKGFVMQSQVRLEFKITGNYKDKGALIARAEKHLLDAGLLSPFRSWAESPPSLPSIRVWMHIHDLGEGAIPPSTGKPCPGIWIYTADAELQQVIAPTPDPKSWFTVSTWKSTLENVFTYDTVTREEMEQRVDRLFEAFIGDVRMGAIPGLRIQADAKQGMKEKK